MTFIQNEQSVRGLPALKTFFKRLLPTSGALREIAPVDGLRALAILLVIWCHLSELAYDHGLNVGPALLRATADFGFCGVFLFFVLSGFLLFLPYARALLEGLPWPSARTFYLRRALRILPLYFTAFLFLLLFPARALLLPQHVVPLAFGALLLQDTRADAFSIVSALDLPLWTLAIEWQFYLVLPWLAWTLAKLAGPRAARGFLLRLVIGLGALVALGLGLRWLAASLYYDWGMGQPVDMPGVLGIALKLLYGVKGKYLEVFALGMAASVVYVLAVEYGRLAHRAWIGLLAGITGIAGLAGCLLWALHMQRVPYLLVHASWWIWLPPDGRLWQILGEWALGVCFALLLIAVLFGAPVFQRCFSLAPLRFLGIISYSLYIWHLPLLFILAAAIVPTAPAPYLHFILLSALVLLLFCTASYYLVERPFIRWRRAAHAPLEREPAPALEVAS